MKIEPEGNFGCTSRVRKGASGVLRATGSKWIASPSGMEVEAALEHLCASVAAAIADELCDFAADANVHSRLRLPGPHQQHISVGKLV